MANLPADSLWTLPNQLTLARLWLSVILFGLIGAEQWLACGVVFALAALTDWLDGLTARAMKLTGELGRTLDPLIDKVLVCGAYIFLLPLGSQQGWLAPWVVAVVVTRELLVTSLRGLMEKAGFAFGADWLGKLKMVLQCAALLAIFATQGVLSQGGNGPPPFALTLIRDGLLWAMLVATVLSGLQYGWKAARTSREGTTT